MKTTITHNPQSTLLFPKLMISDKITIVLMSEYGKGTLLSKESTTALGTKVGQYTEDWNMQKFKDFHGELKLSNS
jgi:hypothetical protein